MKPWPWRAFIVRRARIVSVLCLLGMLLPWLARGLAGQDGILPWLVDLACHWQGLYAALLALSGLTLLWLARPWGVVLLALPLPLLSAAPALPQAGDGPMARLTLVSANVNLDNPDVAALARWLSVRQADVLVLHEVSPAFARGLDSLPGFQFRHVVARDDPFGMALLSRYPIAGLRVVDAADGLIHLDAELDWAGRRIGVTAWHPMPPISAGYHEQRDAMLTQLARRAVSLGRPALLAGDLNASPWSSAFSGLERIGMRRATGLAPTWPALGLAFPGIPIDQVLASDAWSVIDAGRGPDMGSDHYPVFVELAFTGSPD